MKRAIALVCAMVAVANAETKSTIAILEYRAGATALTEIGSRIARILRKETSHPIIEPSDARRADAHIDEEVAKCDGDAKCVAALGRALNADEVILVGVSELGDVILAVQRIDVKTGAVEGRAADSLSHGAEPDDAAIDSYLKKLLPPEDFLRYGTLRVDANLPGALVEVNGKPKGETPIAPLTFQAPTTLELRVSKSGYVDFKARVDLVPDANIDVRPLLTREGGSAWYSKWWVWTIGVAVVAGGVTAGVIALDKKPTNVPVTINF